MAATLFNRRMRLAAALVLGNAASATAQDPPAPFPVPAEESIEVYYGTKRVAADPAPLADAVVPASAVVESPKAVESFRDAMASVREGSREITSAAVDLLGMVGGRIRHTADTRPIIITTTAAPTPALAVQPQVVVVRETTEAKAPVEAPASIRMETLFACGLGLAALGFVAWIGSRKSHRSIATAPTFAYTPMPLDPDSVNLMGKYNAGPKRDDAETFELGPSFREEVQKNEQRNEANNAAAVEFILNQNLAFLAELNPGAEGAMIQTDEEGFAVPAMA